MMYRSALSCALLAATALLCVTPAIAQNVGGSIGEGAGAAPAAVAGGIDASADARNAYAARQADLDRRTADTTYRYGVAAHNCYSRFLVNACLNKARDVMRGEKQSIRAEQITLDTEQRQARSARRARQMALEQASAAAAAPQRATTDAANARAFAEKQRQFELQQAARDTQAPQRANSQRAYDQKQADFQSKLDQARRNGAQEAAQRAENVQRFNAKQESAALRKAQVEERQKNAAQKKASQAAAP